jgi:hypothetical protein
MSKYNYKNPWAEPLDDQFFHTDIEPIDFMGFQIFKKSGLQYDVVKDDACIAQRAGLNGAKALIASKQ